MVFLLSEQNPRSMKTVVLAARIAQHSYYITKICVCKEVFEIFFFSSLINSFLFQAQRRKGRFGVLPRPRLAISGIM